MDVAMISHTISNILQLMNSPKKPLANPLSENDIKQLENNLNQINEKLQKQSGHSSAWLQKVKDVVIDLNDLMEDLSYKESTTSSSIKSFIRSGLTVKNRNKVLKVKKASEELDHLRNEEETKMEEEYKVFGREDEKKEIIDQLLKMNSSVAVPVVIVIVGAPGIGKTKLARRVCEDEQVKANFGPIWIDDLHEKFDVESIEKRVTTTEGKRLLLVLDDLRVEIGRGGLEKVVGGRTDMAILITTRSNQVTNNIAAGHVLKLQGLNQEESWSLFQHIHGPITSTKKEQSTNESESKQEIVRDYGGGVPLLIVIIAMVMKNQSSGGGGDDWILEALQILKCIYYDDLPTYQKLCFAYCSRFPEDDLIDAKKLIQLWTDEGFLTIPTNNNPEQFGQACFNDFVPFVFQQVEEDNKYRMNPLMHKLAKFLYYDKLPTHQKLCFAYCSLFAQDYLIDAERLIQLWSAEGFLTIPSDKTPEQFGRACFDYFVPLVFERVEEENKYRMNPLMHKLAKQVATSCDENIIVDSMGERVRSKMLRASFDYPIDMLSGIPDSMFEKAKKLRTILLPYNCNNPRLPHEVRMTTSTCDKIFNTFLSLRVLDMHDLGIKTVPSSIDEVKYLRYLDLSNNNIEKLPSCITNLIHLQTLKLSQCHLLKELPKDIEDLSCLNHLDTEGCLDLTHMPTGINKITCLQTLSLFVASKKQDMGGLRALIDLENLRGHLEISHLEQVKLSPSKGTAKDEFLKNKKHLELLTLRWEHEEGNEKEKETLLEYLKPHENLRVLFIVGYNGGTLPNWFDSLKYLVKFTLNNCPKCQFLPPLDQLEHLKVLQLRRLYSLKFIAKNKVDSSSSTPKNKEVDSSSSTPILFFKSLKELTISDCPNLESWWENDKKPVTDRPYFGCISKINVQYCPKLASLPLYPGLDVELVLVESDATSVKDTIEKSPTSKSFTPFSLLKSMVIERIEKSPETSWIANFISLQELHIRDCLTLTSLPQGFKSLSSLRTLTIERCQQLDLNISWDGLKSLHSLTLRTIPKLESLPQGLENVNSLKELRLYDCSGLTSLSENIGNLTSLGKLVISECRSLKSLPKGMKNLKSLQTLIIIACPFLLPRSQRETGDDWPQIAHIPDIQLKQTPHDLRDL